MQGLPSIRLKEALLFNKKHYACGLSEKYNESVARGCGKKKEAIVHGTSH